MSIETADEIFKLFNNNKNIEIKELDEILNEKNYIDLVFECSQGLELSWNNERNAPHITASYTGLRNVIKELKTCTLIDLIDNIEVCYVTRSYKTKHGDGTFEEIDSGIKSEYLLYDRTNLDNEYQGSLRYGRIDKDRMFGLIREDYKQLSGILSDDCKQQISLAVTHVDQTNEAVLVMNEPDKFFKNFNSRELGGTKTYYSFGEKSSDIIICEN